MEIVSTNIGEPVTIEWRGQKLQTGIYKYPVEVPIYLGKEDVASDNVIDRRYHGGVDKACYLYSADHYSFWQKEYPDVSLQWGMFGENLTVKGLDEATIRIGDKFKIGTAIVQVTQPRQPCFKLGIRFENPEVVSDFWSRPYPGVYVRVLEEGEARVGDQITRVETNPESLSVADVFSLFRSKKVDSDLIQKAVADSNLAASCRRDLKKLLEI